MYFLDANAWYWYFGRDKLGMKSSAPVDVMKLVKDMDLIQQKSIPVSVYIEVVTHFRDEPEKLQALLKQRFVKGLPVFNNIPDYILTPEELECTAIMGWEELKSYAYRMLEQKIDIEVRFIYLFLEIMRLLFLQFILDSRSELTANEKSAVLTWVGRNYSIDSKDAKVKELKASLVHGYKIKDEQKVIKDKYIEMLNEECVFEQILVEGCVACKASNSDITAVIQKAYKKAVSSGLDGRDGTMKYIDSVLAQDASFLQVAKSKISAMFVKHHYTQAQSCYLRDIMFDAWMDRKQKLRKNDIFDMFCVGVLDYKDSVKPHNVLIDNTTYLVSFDKTMKDFIGEYSASSGKVISKYEL